MLIRRSCNNFKRHRARALAVTFGVLTLVLASTPTFAMTSLPFTASFVERTSLETCPRGTPAGAMCFSGAGQGAAGQETFAGYVDLVVADPITHCAPVHTL